MKELISEIRKNKCDLAICGIVGFKNNIMHNIKQNNKKKLVKKSNFKSIVFSKYGGYLANKMYVANIIKDNKLELNEGIHISEDLLFNLEYLKFCKSIIILENRYYFYRVHSNSSYYNFTNHKWFSVLDTYEIIIDNEINDIRDDVYYNLFMILIEAKYRLNNYFPNDAFIKKRILLMKKKYIKNIKYLCLKHKIKVIIFYIFPKIIMKYKQRKVGE